LYVWLTFEKIVVIPSCIWVVLIDGAAAHNADIHDLSPFVFFSLV
jgi:hypothetical protein